MLLPNENDVNQLKRQIKQLSETISFLNGCNKSNKEKVNELEKENEELRAELDKLKGSSNLSLLNELNDGELLLLLFYLSFIRYSELGFISDEVYKTFEQLESSQKWLIPFREMKLTDFEDYLESVDKSSVDILLNRLLEKNLEKRVDRK